jgi:hypothetical protein
MSGLFDYTGRDSDFVRQASFGEGNYVSAHFMLVSAVVVSVAIQEGPSHNSASLLSLEQTLTGAEDPTECPAVQATADLPSVTVSRISGQLLAEQAWGGPIPVPDADIWLLRFVGGRVYEYQTKTDRLGRFRAALPDGDYLLKSCALGFAKVRAQVIFRETESRDDVRFVTKRAR